MNVSYDVVVFQADGSEMEVAYRTPNIDAALAFVEEWATDHHALAVGIVTVDNELTTTA
jgi:hypothetical protein